MSGGSSSAEAHDEHHARFTTWCVPCRASRPCTLGGPPYRCAVCGALTPNPIMRLTPAGRAAGMGKPMGTVRVDEWGAAAESGARSLKLVRKRPSQ